MIMDLLMKQGERTHICQLLRSAAHKRELWFRESCKIVLKDFFECSFVRVENKMEKASPRVLKHKSMISKDSGSHWLFSLKSWLWKTVRDVVEERMR